MHGASDVALGPCERGGVGGVCVWRNAISLVDFTPLSPLYSSSMPAVLHRQSS